MIYHHCKTLSLAISIVFAGASLSACKTIALFKSSEFKPSEAERHTESLTAQPEHDVSQQITQNHATQTVQLATKTSFSALLPDKPKQAAANRHSDIWSRMRAGFALGHPRNERIQREINWFKKQPLYIDTINERSERYIYEILEQIETRNIPTEIALLPVVESGFDPFAFSSVAASGLWQFMPRTGKSLGLQQNWWLDDRRNIVKSTDAALTYLEKLRKRFNGDWLLALAAYNAGGGNVSKAIRKNKKAGKPTDFWHLDLPKQTKHYVPRLLALVEMYANPQAFNLSLKPITNTPYFEKVDITSQIDLAHAAQLANIDITELAMLNPSFNHFATHPKGPHTLLLPVKHASTFRDKLNSLPPEERVAWQTYTIKKGDSLSRIAQKFDMSMQTIQSVNQLLNNKIREGKTLLIPISKNKGGRYHSNLASLINQSRSSTISTKNKIKRTYTVRSGDSFWLIAKRNGVRVKQIAKWNNLRPSSTIRPGQKLNLYFTQPSKGLNSRGKQSVSVQKMTYQVRSGDSLSVIANKFKLRVNDIRKWNTTANKKYLQPGDKLTLFVDVTRVY